MKTTKKIILLFFYLCSTNFMLVAKDKHCTNDSIILKFDDKGRLLSGLPNFLSNEDKRLTKIGRPPLAVANERDTAIKKFTEAILKAPDYFKYNLDNLCNDSDKIDLNVDVNKYFNGREYNTKFRSYKLISRESKSILDDTAQIRKYESYRTKNNVTADTIIFTIKDSIFLDSIMGIKPSDSIKLTIVKTYSLSPSKLKVRIAGSLLTNKQIEEIIGKNLVSNPFIIHDTIINSSLNITLAKYNYENKINQLYQSYLLKNGIKSSFQTSCLSRLRKIKPEFDKVYDDLKKLVIKDNPSKCCPNENCLSIADCDLIMKESRCSINDIETIKETGIYGYIDCIIDENIDWIIANAWIKGKPLMNPYGFESDSLLKAKIEKLSKSINSEDSSVQKEITELIERLDKNKTLKEKYSIGIKTLNALGIKLSPKKGNMVSNVYHNATENLAIDKGIFPKDVQRFEKDEIVYGNTYNIPKGITCKYSETVTPITSAEANIFTELLNSIGPVPTNDKSIADVFTITEGGPNDSSLQANKQECHQLIDDFVRYYAALEWLLQQTPPITYPALVASDPDFYSKTEKLNKKNQSPAVVQYKIELADMASIKDSSSFNYIAFRKPFTQFFSGVAINFKNDREQTEFKDGKFKNSNLKPVDVVSGIKLYPFNGYNPRKLLPSFKSKDGKAKYNIKRGDYFLNRITLDLGLSLNQNQFRNYFIGVGYELMPGLGISIGGNFYTTKAYKLENNEIIKEKDVWKYSKYFGITLDPISLLKLANIIRYKL